MSFCPWRTDSFLPKETMTHPAPACALETYNMILFTLRPLSARTETVLSQHPWIKVLRETRKPLYEKHLRITPHPPTPNIPSAQWRPSGTGNSLLCIAVLLRRSISAPQRRTHCFFLTKSRHKSHPRSHMWSRSYLGGRNGEIFNALSAWHTWTRTATSPSPPVGTSRSAELFYWRKVEEWRLRVGARISLWLVHERMPMGGIKASCRPVFYNLGGGGDKWSFWLHLFKQSVPQNTDPPWTAYV